MTGHPRSGRTPGRRVEWTRVRERVVRRTERTTGLAAAALVVGLLATSCGSRVHFDASVPVTIRAAPPTAPATQLSTSLLAARPTTTRPEPATTAPRPSGPPRVLVLGDSLVFLSRPELEASLRQAGWAPTIVGLPGRRLDQINALYHQLGLDRIHWDAMVVWAGNNDLLQNDPWTADLRVSVREVAAQRCGVLMAVSQRYWATKLGIPRPEVAVDNPQAVAFNAAEQRAAAAHHLGFIPWQRAINTRQAWFYWDLIHVTPPGAAHAASMVTRAVARCGTAPAPSSRVG